MGSLFREDPSFLGFVTEERFSGIHKEVTESEAAAVASKLWPYFDENTKPFNLIQKSPILRTSMLGKVKMLTHVWKKLRIASAKAGSAPGQTSFKALELWGNATTCHSHGTGSTLPALQNWAQSQTRSSATSQDVALQLERFTGAVELLMLL